MTSGKVSEPNSVDAALTAQNTWRAVGLTQQPIGLHLAFGVARQWVDQLTQSQLVQSFAGARHPAVKSSPQYA